jgi:hypothetical protein
VEPMYRATARMSSVNLLFGREVSLSLQETCRH